MKPIFKLFLVSLSLSSVIAQQPSADPSPKFKATMKRSVTGRILDDRGLAAGNKTLMKDKTYNVLTQELGYVVIQVEQDKVSVPVVEVAVSPGSVGSSSVSDQTPSYRPTESPTVASTSASIPAGNYVLISAKYTLEGNQPRNVKNKIAKLLPDGQVTRTVSFRVTDDICPAAKTQGNSYNVFVTSTRYVVKTRPLNVLTVVYTFNDKLVTKEVVEGSVLVLP
jgi:hypothetical protein